MNKFLVFITVLFFIGTTEFVCAQSSKKAEPLPPHNYILAGRAESQDTNKALARVRKCLISAFAKSGLVKEGYPKPCHIVTRPDSSKAGASHVSCEVLAGRTDEPDGILFTEEKHFMQLSIIDFPDSRVYLAEVFIVPSLPDPRISSLERYNVPRVALHFPLFPISWHPRIWWLIQEGIESSGAEVVELLKDGKDGQQGVPAATARPRR
jgi:hypothetical protein